MRLADYVTGGLRKEEKKLMEDAVLRAVSALECIMEKGIQQTMNEYNSKEPVLRKAGNGANEEAGDPGRKRVNEAMKKEDSEKND